MAYRDPAPAQSQTIELTYRPVSAFGRVAIALILGLPILGLSFVVMTKHTDALDCTRSSGGECVVTKRYLVTTIEERYPLDHVGSAMVDDVSRKDGPPSFEVTLDVGPQTMTVARASSSAQANADVARIKGFLSGASSEEIHVPAMGASRGLLAFVLVLCSAPFLALMLSFMQSVRIVVDWSQRRLRLVRNHIFYRKTLEFPLDSLEGAKVEVKYFRQRSGASRPAARVYICARDGTMTPILNAWGTPAACDAVSGRINAVLEAGPAAVNVAASDVAAT